MGTGQRFGQEMIGQVHGVDNDLLGGMMRDTFGDFKWLMIHDASVKVMKHSNRTSINECFNAKTINIIYQ